MHILDPQQIAHFDLNDPLGHFGEEFAKPSRENGEPWVYLCGNSLGLDALGGTGCLEGGNGFMGAAGGGRSF